MSDCEDFDVSAAFLIDFPRPLEWMRTRVGGAAAAVRPAGAGAAPDGTPAARSVRGDTEFLPVLHRFAD